MDLILWRHAHAEDLTKNMQSDADRKLTSKGQQQATRMALWLNNVLPHNCSILVSPSQRTIQTAQALERQFNIVAEIGSGSSPERILKACNWPNNREPVLVIGHQPSLGQVVSKLIPTFQNVSVRKANVWWISQTNEGVFLKAVMSPELIAK